MRLHKWLFPVLFFTSALNGLSAYSQMLQKGKAFKITYNHICNFNHVPDTTKAILISNPRQSVYTYGISKPEPSRVVTYTDTDGSVHEVLVAASKGDSSGKFIIKNFNKRTLMSLEKVTGESFIVHDTLDLIHWVQTAETKNILGYQVCRATAAFRGRNYTAWYTKQVDLFDGPWKFSGLNGLILEIYDDTGEVKFEMTGIQIDHYSHIIPEIADYAVFENYEQFKLKEEELERKDIDQAVLKTTSKSGKKINMVFKRSKLEM